MPPRKAQTATSVGEMPPWFRSWRATGVPRTPATPASPAIASSGSCLASTACSDSSRNETKTARGATSTAGARSHQLRSSTEVCAVSAVAAMYRSVASALGEASLGLGGGHGARRQHVLQEAARGALLDLHHVLGRADGDELAARLAAFRPEVDHPVGLLDHVEVVLDHDHRVAAVDEALQRLEQLLA